VGMTATEDIVDADVAEDLPFAKSPSGWCQDALQAIEWGMPAHEIQRLHLACPSTFWPATYRDPARAGARYKTAGHRCPCVCHTRPATLGSGAPTQGA